MNYYRIILFIALHLLLYNVHQFLPSNIDEVTRWRVFDTCKSAILLTAPLLLWCVPSLIGMMTLLVHFVFLLIDAWQTWQTGDTGSTSTELYIYFSAIAILFVIRAWFGDAQLQYHRQWRINAKRKLSRLLQRSKV